MKSFDNLDNCQECLLKLLSFSLFDDNVNCIFDDEFDFENIIEDLFNESVNQAVSIISWDAIGKLKDRYFAKSAVKYRQYSAMSLRNNINAHQSHYYIHKLLTENNIDYCILKGCSSAYYYPEPMLRTMGDVDFLVKKQDVEKTALILKNEGFKQWDKDNDCHIVFSKGDMRFEMHFEPAGLPDGEAREVLLKYLDDVFDKSSIVQIEQNEFYKPSDFHHGIIILMHTYHHLVSEGIGLRHLCDLAVFFNHFSDDEFTSLFYDKLTSVGLWKFTQFMAQVCCKYLALPYRKWIGEFNDDLIDNLILDIFNGGNFGSKDLNRSKEGNAISGPEKSKNSIVQMIKNLNEASAFEFKIVRKIKLLRHIGWLMIIIRFVFRVISGKRKAVNIVKLLGNVQKRKQIYEKFEIYEINEKVD